MVRVTLTPTLRTKVTLTLTLTLGLVHNTEYTVVVHKFSSINNTSTSAVVTTLDVVAEDIIPSAPVLTTGEIRPTALDLIWLG